MTIRFIQPLNNERPAPIEVVLDGKKAEIRLICVQRNSCLTLSFKIWDQTLNRASKQSIVAKLSSQAQLLTKTTRPNRPHNKEEISSNEQKSSSAGKTTPY